MKEFKSAISEHSISIKGEGQLIRIATDGSLLFDPTTARSIADEIYRIVGRNDEAKPPHIKGIKMNGDGKIEEGIFEI